MTNDRALLEAAARAAGIDLEWDGPPELWQPMYYHGKTYHGWNPLEDDGNALRLAVKLRIHIRMFPHDIEAQHEREYWHEYDGADSYAATRRAIVRAAAAMAKEQQK